MLPSGRNIYNAVDVRRITRPTSVYHFSAPPLLQTTMTDTLWARFREVDSARC